MNLEDLYRLLRSGHVQAQGIVDTLDSPLLVLDGSLNVIQINRAFCATFHVPRDETIDHAFFALGNGQWDIPELRRLLLDVIPKSAAVVGYEVTHDFPNLGLRTMLVTARRLVHPDDVSTTMLVAFDDITEKRHAAAQNDIILEETRHRMKNLLGTMRAIANLTRTEGRTAEEYKKAFLGRFQAVVEAQDLSLADEPEQDLEMLARKATDSIAGRVAITPGPAITLPRGKAGSLGLVLHEMVTNAMKYGAASRPGGLVRISWELSGEKVGRKLCLQWREENGPAPPASIERGFGSQLIDYEARELGGAAELTFEPGGCRMQLTFPVD
ncbi:MAG: sensor histidine kinase [Beijerinckiaceae bacterium]